MRNFRVWLSLLAAVFWATALTGIARADDTAPVISNFKFGLVCGAADNRRVCFQTDNVQITNESRCVYNHSPIACTWYGYSFDYVSPTDAKINCEESEDLLSAFGNPKEVLSPSASVFKFELGLKQGSHHFYVGQYTGGEKEKRTVVHASESCSFAGKSLFSVSFQFEYSESMQPVESVPDVSGKK